MRNEHREQYPFHRYGTGDKAKGRLTPVDSQTKPIGVSFIKALGIVWVSLIGLLFTILVVSQ